LTGTDPTHLTSDFTPVAHASTWSTSPPGGKGWAEAAVANVTVIFSVINMTAPSCATTRERRVYAESGPPWLPNIISSLVSLEPRRIVRRWSRQIRKSVTTAVRPVGRR
jgi:hypothetical protein